MNIRGCFRHLIEVTSSSSRNLFDFGFLKRAAFSPLHFDASISTLTQLKGQKTFLLFSPFSGLSKCFLYPDWHPLRRRSRLSIDDERIRNELRAYKATLSKGDVLIFLRDGYITSSHRIKRTRLFRSRVGMFRLCQNMFTWIRHTRLVSLNGQRRETKAQKRCVVCIRRDLWTQTFQRDLIFRSLI